MNTPSPASGVDGIGGNAGLTEGLARIVGKDHVLDKPEEIVSYFRGDADPGGLVAVRPGSTGDVQEVMRLAASRGIPVRTINDRYLRAADQGQEGIVLDFSRMTAIEKLDKRNLLAHVQRGLTFDAFRKQLDAQGLRMDTPVAATSDSVLCNLVNRAPLKKATLYSEVNVYTMQVVLVDGTLFRTGSHALNEDACDLREDGGPSLSRWFFGSDDIYGVITRATVWIYPKAESRQALAFGFDRLEEVVQALRDGPRTEQGWEYVATNRRFLASQLGDKVPELPEWTIIVGFEGREKLVENQKRNVLKMMQEKGGKPLDDFSRTACELLDRVWYQASPFHTGFYCVAPRVKEFDGLVRKRAADMGVDSGEVGHCMLAIDRSRSLYSMYDIFGEVKVAGPQLEAMEKELASAGAFYDRPQGAVSDAVLDSVPNLRTQIRTIKEVMDPQGTINPGRYVRMEDPVYRPLAVDVETAEDTDISVASIRKVEALLKEAVGEDWVSSNPADLISYGRDFTVFAGEKPNIVVLPETTEDVQKIMRIGYSNKIPVVPWTTGFNHGGLSIPRKGGILVDLKRMNKLIDIDEESLTATFQPGVRMRSLWHECQKVETTRGLKLKPILPMTLSSISLLSNYVSRGGPGSAVKYGGGPDLTVNMTWVLPNGEVFKTGPSAVPGVGNTAITWGAGPDVGGMFFNADGAFGICTEITVKVYPEMPHEQMISTAIFEEDPVGIEKACNSIYDLAQEHLVEFMYKSHPGVMVVTLGGMVDTNPVDLVSVAPKHPLAILVTGLDEEELAVRAELVGEVLDRNGVIQMDPAMFGDGFEALISTDPLKKSVGVKNNAIGAYKGAFQWQAGYVKIEDVPRINAEYNKLIKKYWKTSDVKISMEGCLTGTDLQGPLPFGRFVALEFDYWWDQGNPEDVKRATNMIRKTTELMIRNGCVPIRNMFGLGDLLIPRLAVYKDILKNIRKTFDPANLMHPDVLPVTDDWV